MLFLWRNVFLPLIIKRKPVNCFTYANIFNDTNFRRLRRLCNFLKIVIDTLCHVLVKILFKILRNLFNSMLQSSYFMGHKLNTSIWIVYEVLKKLKLDIFVYSSVHTCPFSLSILPEMYDQCSIGRRKPHVILCSWCHPLGGRARARVYVCVCVCVWLQIIVVKY